MKIGDKYIIPASTTIWLTQLQQRMTTTKRYVAVVTHTIAGDDDAFFCDLHEITFQHTGVPGLIKVPHCEALCSASMTEPIGDALEPKTFEYSYANERKGTCDPKCEHLNVTESEQDAIYAKTGKKPQHYCRKYGKALRHGGLHPLLARLDECRAGGESE